MSGIEVDPGIDIGRTGKLPSLLKGNVGEIENDLQAVVPNLPNIKAYVRSTRKVITKRKKTKRKDILHPRQAVIAVPPLTPLLNSLRNLKESEGR